ncbi:MAG: hypothetical protein R2682_14815 [Pyrinomonadaceae bacterium]
MPNAAPKRVDVVRLVSLSLVPLNVDLIKGIDVLLGLKPRDLDAVTFRLSNVPVGDGMFLEPTYERPRL